MANIPQLRAVLRHNVTWRYIGPIPQTPEVCYCYYNKLATSVIRAAQINVLSYQWYTV
jgi:hypothetical protein